MKDAGYALDSTWRTLLKDLGVSPANVLLRAGLPADLLVQPQARVPAADYYRLWRGLEEELTADDLAIRLCEAIRSESFLPPLFAAMCSPNLLMAAQRIQSYKPLVAPIRLQISKQSGLVTIEFHWLDGDLPPPASLVWMELLFCVTLARMGTRERILPFRVTTLALPKELQPYTSYLGVEMKLSDGHRVVFHESDALRPFLTSNESLWSAFEPSLKQRLADLTSEAKVSQRIRAALTEALPSGMASIDYVAGKLAMSRRTLQRRMEHEGVTYQQLLSQARHDLAGHYLRKTGLPVAEISFLLGYEETNSFYRAFKTWTGVTPDTFRSQNSAGTA